MRGKSEYEVFTQDLAMAQSIVTKFQEVLFIPNTTL